MLDADIVPVTAADNSGPSSLNRGYTWFGCWGINGLAPRAWRTTSVFGSERFTATLSDPSSAHSSEPRPPTSAHVVLMRTAALIRMCPLTVWAT